MIPISTIYPNGRVLNYNYASGVDNVISRLSSISGGPDNIVDKVSVRYGPPTKVEQDKNGDPMYVWIPPRK